MECNNACVCVCVGIGLYFSLHGDCILFAHQIWMDEKQRSFYHQGNVFKHLRKNAGPGVFILALFCKNLACQVCAREILFSSICMSVCCSCICVL